MQVIVMKDSGMIVDFGDLGETLPTLTTQGRYNATFHDAVDVTPTYPSNPTTFRNDGTWQSRTWFWQVVTTSFIQAEIVLPQVYTHGQKTRAEMLALSPSVGDTCYCSTYDLEFWWTGNTWQCAHTIEGKNNSGATVYEGDCLVPSAAVENAYSTTTTMYHPSIVGTTVFGAVQGGWMTIAVSGIWQQYVYGTLSVGEHIVSYTTNGNGYGVGGPPASVSGQFATAKEAKGTSPIALVKVQIGIMAHY